MAVAFHPGAVLGPDDLKILIRNNQGIFVDPFYIRYSLFDYTTGVEVLIGPQDRIPATSGTGQYYVNATIPLDANIGGWTVRWNFRETHDSPMIQVVQEFAVVKSEIRTEITDSDKEALMVRRLRILLRDNNPDRNYSVAGHERVGIKANGRSYYLTMEELWGIVEDGKNGLL